MGEHDHVTADVERRIQQLEDIENVRRSKALYAIHFDEVVNGADDRSSRALLAQFTPDATWECDCFGRFRGRDEIGGFLEEYRRRVSFCLHYILGHVVTVAPDRATAHGRWITWEPMTVEGRAVLLAGHYEDELERAGQTWLFRTVRLEVAILTAYDQGWGRERIMADLTWRRPSSEGGAAPAPTG